MRITKEYSLPQRSIERIWWHPGWQRWQSVSALCVFSQPATNQTGFIAPSINFSLTQTWPFHTLLCMQKGARCGSFSVFPKLIYKSSRMKPVSKPYLLKKTKQNISMYSSLVSLIQHDDTILKKVWINKTLSKQHTICHVFDLCLRTCTVFKTDCVPNLHRTDIHYNIRVYHST